VSDVRRVLIVGGGIGGLCAAIALRRVGVEVEVVERNPRWDTYGVGIIQPPNAIRALAMLGLAEECVAAGYPMQGSRSHDRLGAVISDIDFERPAGMALPVMNGLARPQLHRILSAATLRSGASVRTGTTFTTIEQDPDAVEVAFTDSSRGRYDLVIGADGIHSQVRAEVFGPKPAPELSGQIVWRYNLPRYPGLTRLWMFDGSRGRAGFVPLAQELMYVLLVEKPPEDEPARPPAEQLAEVFRERLAEFGGPVAAVREEITDPAGVVLRAIETIFLPSPWYRGRVLLIGDAAHATSPHVGQGAAQAIEDAVVLADELAGGKPLAQALEGFMSRRYERCRIVVEGSLQIGRWEQEGATDADYVGTVRRVTDAVAAPL
jgi:2-polyprenyl-6-methoxyphenol hydroxylase-like FAD-dependent oxidoreductase